MNLSYSAEDLAFRATVRDFVGRELPVNIAQKVRLGKELEKADYVTWQKILHDQGWIAPDWPEEYGGTGWTATQQYIFEQECIRGGAPALVAFGLQMVGHVIYTFGTDAQKQRFLPRILSSDDWWCQGYSEPGAGSDLASLRTRAEDHGGHFLVNGQKTWTTWAQHADWMFCLARTDSEVKPQLGITFLLIDMTTPGVSVRPIPSIDKRAHINEVFLSDVKVPRDCLIGEVNKGWDYAKFLLGYERMTIARVAHLYLKLDILRDLAANQNDGLSGLSQTESFRLRLAEIELDLMALEYGELRVLLGQDDNGVAASMLKIQGSEIEQAIAELTIETLGYQALPYDPPSEMGCNAQRFGDMDIADGAVNELLFGRARTIFGGSNEIQKNIIYRAMLRN